MAASDLITSLEAAQLGRINSTPLYDFSIAQHRQMVEKIAQAYDFHGFLDSLHVRSQNNDDDPTHTFTPSLVLPDSDVLIQAHKQRLLFPNIAGEYGDGGCSNAAARQNYWKKDPSFPFSHTGVGFLYQIFHLCNRAGLQQCGNVDCISMWTNMDADAPPCESWPEFRDWAITAMSCQAVMRAAHADIMPPHTHIARAVAGCCMILRECLPSDSLKPGMQDMFHPHFHNAPDEEKIHIHEVVELIYWMAIVQYHLGIGPDRFGRWGTKLLPNTITYSSLNMAHEALDLLQEEGFCKARVWGLIEVCDRKEADLVGIVAALRRNATWLRHDKSLADLKSRKHRRCVANRCQTDHVDTTSVSLIHKCRTGKCGTLFSPSTKMDDLKNAVQNNTSTAWHFVQVVKEEEDGGESRERWFVPDRLSKPGEKYMAISHVWADGTGGRLDAVSACLFDYFARIAKSLGCDAIWWDSISVPSGEEKQRALQTMNLRYIEATVTLVHDSYLLGIDATEREPRCLGIVLSGWYTRMWTAMELAKSKDVRVMFGGSEEPVDLNEILVHGPEHCSQAHWMAGSSIRRLREPVNDLGDLISVLRPRATSKLLDRTIVALNLAEVPEIFFGTVDNECDMTMQLLRYLGRIPQSCLLHGKPTIKTTGGFSWCPGSLDDLPAPTSQTNMKSREVGELISMLRVSTKGVVTGEWWCRDLAQVSLTHNVLPYGTDRPSTVRTELALHTPERYIILSPAAHAREDAALLAMPLSVTSASIRCRYIGAVTVLRTDFGNAQNEQGKDWHMINISLGVEERDSQSVMEGRAALSQAHDSRICLLCLENPWAADKVETSQSDYIRYYSDDHPLLLDLDRLTSLLVIQPEPEPHELLDHTPTNKHLMWAVQAEREKSIQYLVNQGINLEQDDLDGLPLNKATVCGLWALASAYIAGAQSTEPPSEHFDELEKAIAAFSKAIELGKNWDPSMGGGYSWLVPQLQLNFGRLLQIRHDNDEEALRLFNEALSASRKERVRRIDETATEHVKRSYWRAQQRTTSWQISSPRPMADEDKEDADFFAAWDCSEEGWKRIEWDALAELVLANAENTQYRQAASSYCEALVKVLVTDEADKERQSYIRDCLTGSEVFHESQQRFKLTERLGGTEVSDDVRRRFMLHDTGIPERTEGLAERSKRYETAFMWFQFELSRDHLLVSLTRLHLGASLALWGQLVEAEKHLRHALKDFQSRLAWQRQHAIIAFTQFHLGMTIGQLGELREDLDMIQEAEYLLIESKDYFASSTSQWIGEVTQRALNKVAQDEAQMSKAQTEAPAPDTREDAGN